MESVSLEHKEAVCTSLDAVEKFKKEHKSVLEEFKNILEEYSTEKSAQHLKESLYRERKGKMAKMTLQIEQVVNFTPKEIAELIWDLDVGELAALLHELTKVAQPHLIEAQVQYLENFNFRQEVVDLVSNLYEAVKIKE